MDDYLGYIFSGGLVLVGLFFANKKKTDSENHPPQFRSQTPDRIYSPMSTDKNLYSGSCSVYDGYGQMIGRMDGGRVFNGSGMSVGRIEGDCVYGAGGGPIGWFRNELIYNSSGGTNGRFSGDFLHDSTGITAGMISGDRILVNGVPGLRFSGQVQRMDMILYFFFFYKK